MLWSPCNYSNIIQRSYTLLLINKDHFLFLLLLVIDHFELWFQEGDFGYHDMGPIRIANGPSWDKVAVGQNLSDRSESPISIEKSPWNRDFKHISFLKEPEIAKNWSAFLPDILIECYSIGHFGPHVGNFLTATYFASKTTKWFSVKFIQKNKIIYLILLSIMTIIRSNIIYMCTSILVQHGKCTDNDG